jgi:DNA (cytosine-5)-methyltransferase 1
MITIGSDFSGVGAFDQALIRLGIDYKTIFACDMDKYARQTYIHNYGEPQYYPENVYDREIPNQSLDIYMTSPPCQAFSLAGKRKGEDDKRGILFYNSHEFIQKNKPRFFIFENVKGLLSDDSGKTFQRWIDFLGGKTINGNPTIFPHEDSVPYHIYYQVLNAKNYGVPQNRERIFIIGIRDDQDNNFSFPKPYHLEKRLKDVLEYNVDEKYYLSDTLLTWIDKHRAKRDSSNKYPLEEDDISACMTARYGKNGAEDPYVFQEKAEVIQLNPSKESNGGKQPYQQNRIYDINGINPALSAGQNLWGGNIIKLEDEIDLEGVMEKYNKEINQSINQDICTGIDASYYKGFGVRQGKCRQVVKDKYKIRRLTPRECFRLMDFPDTFDFSVVSNSQAYKQAGNSIVVNVLCEIIKKLKI